MRISFFRILLTAAALQAATAAVAAPQAGSTASAPAQQEIVLAGSQASIAGPAETFTGRARIDPLWSANKDINAAGAMVTFEPGARSAWHTHPFGQRLVVSSGVGLVQEWGKPVQLVRPGDAIWCPPGVKHWHGAAPKTAVTYLTVTGTVNDKNVDWMEKVTDDQYDGKQAR
jgi:quercetin dioxygenase-like cupin family protein